MKKYLLTALSVAILAGTGGYFAGTRGHAEPAQPAQPERKVLYWYDPMVPGQRFDKPGKSPFMDMQLVPRYADEGQHPTQSGVSISPQQQQNLGMVVQAAQMRSLTPAFQAWATVTTDDRSLQTVPSPANGVVEKLFVRAPQQWVKAGEPLAQLWIPTWTTAQQEYLAVRQLGDAALTRAARERLALQFMPEAIVREVERSGKPQTRLTLRAEKAGYVAKLDTREGAQVAATAPLFELAGLDPVWLVVDYPQSQASGLAVGSEVRATSESWPGLTFHGRVSELLPQMETTTRTLKARIVLDNPQQKLKPGMYLRVEQASRQASSPVLAIPEEALIATGSSNRVIVAGEEGHFQAVNVTPGLSAEGWTEIRTGLKEGDRVVTSGQFLIDSEASLRSALPEAPVAQDHSHHDMGDAQ
ncbi:efflux RND transporter periplasmic adaptor subunit [Enterobacter sp. CC120223-11]|uniref:efflux RND transporter periplasmic adaptor subunit n=1 Tax=Enterobacter sp. CC120223-11 TaxID=1378073 RepID=UPI000BD5C238|nr:efflux RND transporter periplasmic adaptor subunit [Enterobacter sp. CC120223-11]SNY78487.1 membrane fusion protein, Cu(I)/Ag(I) efflux system [Enterobacter sp. CC120223-11]